MRRSAGITISAVIIFVGSAFTLLCAALMTMMAVLGPRINPRQQVVEPMGFLMGITLLYLGLTAWGTATGVGLLMRREWARISLLIFGVFLLFGFVFMGIFAFWIPFPTSVPNDRNPEATRMVMDGVRIFLAVVAGAFAALGGWWLYYFGRRATSEEFRMATAQRVASRGTAAVGHENLPAGTVPPPMAQSRPVSISIIAVLMLIGAVNFPLIGIMHAPLLMFGYLLNGWAGKLLLLTLGAAQVAAGVGLLKLKLWGRSLAIAVAILGLCNVAVSALLPGTQARFDQATQQIHNQWNVAGTATAPFHFPIALVLLPMLPFFLVELWFLVREKPAFVAAEAKAK
jgi:uncharacterized membrane protein YuzA (DUF378 family)